VPPRTLLESAVRAAQEARPGRPDRPDGLLAWVIGFGPALACAAWVLVRLGPDHGFALAALVAGLLGLGVLGLSALTLAFLPATLERLGLGGLASHLRRRWDRDAR
jgi:apolipoprotein N-acyltransferase